MNEQVRKALQAVCDKAQDEGNEFLAKKKAEKAAKKALAKLRRQQSKVVWIHWEGSPMGSGTLKGMLDCGYRSQRKVPSPWNPRVGAQVGWLTQLCASHALWTKKIRNATHKRCKAEFQKWRDEGIEHSYTIPENRKDWKPTQMPPWKTAKLETDLPRGEKGFKWKDNVLDIVDGVLDYFEKKGIEVVEIETALSTKELFTFYEPKPTTAEEQAAGAGPWKLTSFTTPLTTFGDFLVRLPGREKLVLVDLKTTSRWDLVNLAPAALSTDLKDDIQAAIHVVIAEDHGWDYARLYVNLTYPYKVRSHGKGFNWVEPKPDKLIAWLRYGPVMGHKSPGYSNCNDCMNRRLCWGVR